ncbi:MAG: transposase [Dehalococcoidia bacterium]
MSEALGYFLTWTTSGTWLHGDERGSKDRNTNGLGDPNVPPNAGLNRYRRFQLGDQEFRMDSSAKRAAIREAIERTCRIRGWQIWGLNVRTNHIHVVLSATPPPEEVMASLKAWATKELVARKLVSRGERVWTRHGSTRYLWTEEDVEDACTYTVEGQGRALD